MIVSPIEKDSAITGSDLQYLALFYSYASYSGAKILRNKIHKKVGTLYNKDL